MATPSADAAPGEVLGERVVELVPCRWGFTNDTAVATLASGRHVVFQRVTHPERAQVLVRLLQTIPPRLTDAGIRSPHLLHADLSLRPPLLVREHVPGEAANTLLSTPDSAALLACQMGALLPLLRQAALDGLELDGTWAQPDTLAAAAYRWLGEAAAVLSDTVKDILGSAIDGLATSWPEQPPVLAHGDFCPVNAIVEGDRVVALVDLELARTATGFFDAAWWGWVVRYHHPARWQAIWPVFLEAAGIANTPHFREHTRALQLLRCLELLVDSATPGQAQGWAERLEATAEWE
jgi:hypothetical protein